MEEETVERDIQEPAQRAAELEEKVRKRKREQETPSSPENEESVRQVTTGIVTGVNERNRRLGPSHELIIDTGEGETITFGFNQSDVDDPSTQINGLLRINNVKPRNFASIVGEKVTVFDEKKVAAPKSGLLTDRVRHRVLRAAANLGLTTAPSEISDRFNFSPTDSWITNIGVLLLALALFLGVGSLGVGIFVFGLALSVQGALTLSFPEFGFGVLFTVMGGVFSFFWVVLLEDEILDESDLTKQVFGKFFAKPVRKVKQRVRKLNERL